LYQKILLQIEVEMDIAFIEPAGFLKLLAHEIRWKLLALLAQSDYRVQELVCLLNQPQNLVSYHLRLLRDQHVVLERRSSADARDIYYSLDLARLRSAYLVAGQALHPALAQEDVLLDEQASNRDHPPLRVLFLCTENSARSQMAEALLRQLSQGRIEAFSAGSKPTRLHPLTLSVLEAQGLDASRLRAKSIDEFAGQSFDYIVTVCDRVRESCPTFPDDPACIHWSLADPATVEGSEEERSRAFEETFEQLSTRIHFLLTVLARVDRRK
jgi:ArsR family transcriptional regulator, arsenate/arsenite/antimonite-responsive transcriptional repressor / arsenate reductase (thioredoxin)